MTLESIWAFIQNHWILSVIAGFFLLSAAANMGFHSLYLFVIAAAGIIAWAVGYPLYFWPFLMGMTTAFAEIINKFDDEPMKALKTLPALLYHILNGLISVFALYLLALVAGKPPTFAGTPEIDQLKYAMAAGLGAMLIMRSKLFNIKVGEDNVSFGPEQIINTLFSFMESAIDRIRARDRRKFIEDKLKNIKFDAVYDHCVMTFRRATRAISDEARARCLEELRGLHNGLDGLSKEQKTDAAIQLRSYEIGYILYDQLGEVFVSELFANPPIEWRLRAVDPDEVKNTGGLPTILNVTADNAFVKKMPFVGTKEEVVPYMAYGTNMSSHRIRERLNWTDAAGQESLKKTNPVQCTLKDYRLAFNRVSDANSREGMANLVSESGQHVEGVLYQLPKTALDFIDNNEPGYHKIKVKVITGESETEAVVFVADSDKMGPEHPPNQADLASMIEGAGEHGLSQTYVDFLRDITAAPVTANEVETVGNGNRPT